MYLYLVTTYLISPKKLCHGKIQIGLYFNRVDNTNYKFKKYVNNSHSKRFLTNI